MPTQNHCLKKFLHVITILKNLPKQKFYHTCKKKLHDVDDRHDDSDDDSDDVSDARKFHGNVVEPDISIDDCDDKDCDDIFEARKFHDDVAEPGINVEDDDSYDVFDARKIHGDIVEPDIDADDNYEDEELSVLIAITMANTKGLNTVSAI